MSKKTTVLTTLGDDGNLVELYPEVVTDTTLSISGKPADAAAVGEALTNIQPGDNSVTLTQAEYDALSDKEKDSDTTYYISDGYAQPNAFSVPFTSDKYNATTTGDALNEVKTELEETNSNLKLKKNGITNNVNIYLAGNTVCITFDGVKPATAGTWTTIGTITDESLRPPQTIYASAYVTKSLSNYGAIAISKAGVVQIISSGVDVYGSVTYLVNNQGS